MDNILKDNRFTKLINDPRYREIPKTQRKIKIDKRFQSMFDSEKFKIKYTIDKRGKPVNQSSTENLRKYYDLSSEESDDSSDDSENEKNDQAEIEDDEVGKFVRPPKHDEEKSSSSEDDLKNNILNSKLVQSDLPKIVRKKLRDIDTDYARGEGALFSDSSSDEETSNEDEEDEVEHGWGELDADADTCEDATNRIAVCNMDWDNIKAADLFVLFNSFLPPGGLVKNVTIYPSEFGLKRMKEEELRGPIELTETKKAEINDPDSNDDENEEGSKYHMEKLRQYQLNRLKYYYAVIVFDSASTANKIYSDCDGIEYESSATKLDLRFIPDDVTFDQEIYEECTDAPEINRYKPRLFTTTALQQAKVELTWDATNPHRSEFLKGAAGGDVNDEDIKNYLAYSSSDEESENESEKSFNKSENNDEKKDPVSKYKALLLEIEENDQKKKNRDVEMEITWGLGLKEKTQELVQKKLNKPEKMTPFEEMIEKQKEKRKAKKLEKRQKKAETMDSDSNQDAYSSDDIPSDVDMNDPYFAEEFNNKDFKKKTKKNNSIKNQNNDINSDDEKKRAELELLLDDDNEKSHFSLKKIQEAENETKSKKKRLKRQQKNEVKNGDVQDFEINVQDERFSALFSSHHYNIDPTDPNYKKTKAMEKLIQEKLKRRPIETGSNDYEKEPKKNKKDPALTVLVNNIKRKTGNFNIK